MQNVFDKRHKESTSEAQVIKCINSYDDPKAKANFLVVIKSSAGTLFCDSTCRTFYSYVLRCQVFEMIRSEFGSDLVMAQA